MNKKDPKTYLKFINYVWNNMSNKWRYTIVFTVIYFIWYIIIKNTFTLNPEMAERDPVGAFMIPFILAGFATGIFAFFLKLLFYIIGLWEEFEKRE